MYRYASTILHSQYARLIFWTVALAVLTQAVKKLAKQLGVRHHPAFEWILPWVPSILGIVSGALSAHSFGVSALVTDQAGPFLGAFFGAGVGFVASGLFRGTRIMLDDDSRWAKLLNVYAPEEIEPTTSKAAEIPEHPVIPLSAIDLTKMTGVGSARAEAIRNTLSKAGLTTDRDILRAGSLPIPNKYADPLADYLRQLRGDIEREE
jgi:hypothetical protein